MTRLDRHHLLFDRETWTSAPHLYNVRTNPGLILKLPMVELHRPLHRSIRSGVPLPSEAAAVEFAETVLPYELHQPLFRTVDQAIGFFAMAGEQPTAEHLYEQKQFILGRLAVEEAA